MTNLEIRHDLELGWTLPAEWYTSPEILALEKRQIFGRMWQYAGPASKVAQPGDFVTYRAGDVPLVVARGEDGELRAFANVCRHRGSEVVLEGSGNRKTLQCHYHGWTYDLAGRLRAAPRFATERPGFDAAAISLPPASVDAWG